MWCCKDCIGIIKEDTNATYQEIRVKVEAAAEPLPEVTGVAASTVPTAGESTDHSQEVQAAVAKVEARAVAAEAEAHALKAEAQTLKAMAAASAGVAPKGKSINGRGPRRSALIKRIFSKLGCMRKQGPRIADLSQSIEPSADRGADSCIMKAHRTGRVHNAIV